VEEKEQKGKRQGSKKLECFICRDEHYAASCLYHKKLFYASCEQQGKDNEDERQINVAFEANGFHTYLVNAISYQGFKSTKVLLDNQADISIRRPGLL
jgi:hypothetical protein